MTNEQSEPPNNTSTDQPEQHQATKTTIDIPDDANHPNNHPKNCHICGKEAAKYCCPRCNQRSCSLGCVTAHKEQSGCTGKRDRTGFIGRGQLDERSLLSDYRFLEEIKLAEDIASRSKPPPPKSELPHYLQSLVYQAKRRGVQLHILPPGMHRRKINTSKYITKRQLITWRIEWKFPAAGNECNIADPKVEETSTLEALLRAHLTLQPGVSVKKAELQEYIDVDFGELTVLLRKERTPADQKEYYKIDLKQTLQHELEGKIIVEYPVFLVVLKRELSEYQICESLVPTKIDETQQRDE